MRQQSPIYRAGFGSNWTRELPADGISAFRRFNDGAANDTVSPMGIRNSSLTRVQPVLDSLHASDPTGTNWLLPLLRLASRSNCIADDFAPGQLSTPPQYEFSAPPPREFLRFLLANPATLAAPPERVWRKWNEITQVKRRAFLAGDAFIQREGLRSLDAARDLSERAWWRFEGVTSVDCALFTESTVVFIEGKRTEDGPSRQVTWWAGRNQVIRNMECALELARATSRSHAFVLLVVEEDLCGLGTDRARNIEAVTDPSVIANSLPHLDPSGRDQIMRCYLGWTTWQAIVRKMVVDPAVLVDTVQPKGR